MILSRRKLLELLGAKASQVMINAGKGENGYGILTVSGRPDALSEENIGDGYCRAMNSYIGAREKGSFVLADKFSVSSTPDSAKTVNVTAFSKLFFRGSVYATRIDNAPFYAGLSKTPDNNIDDFDALFSDLPTQGRTSWSPELYELDVSSLTGDYYIKFVIHNNGAAQFTHGIIVYDLYFEN